MLRNNGRYSRLNLGTESFKFYGNYRELVSTARVFSDVLSHSSSVALLIIIIIIIIIYYVNLECGAICSRDLDVDSDRQKQTRSL